MIPYPYELLGIVAGVSPPHVSSVYLGAGHPPAQAAVITRLSVGDNFLAPATGSALGDLAVRVCKFHSLASYGEKPRLEDRGKENYPMANVQKITTIAVLTQKTNAVRYALWFGAGAGAMLALVGALVTLSPIKAATAASEVHEKVQQKDAVNKSATDAETSHAHQASDRTPARVEGDLSPEANELLHSAGQKFERMLDRSTRSY